MRAPPNAPRPATCGGRSRRTHPPPLTSQAGGGVAGKAAVAAGASAVGYTAVTAAPAKPREPVKRP
jgi:hypothetical protein